MKKLKIYIFGLFFLVMISCKNDNSETEIKDRIKNFYTSYIEISSSSIPLSEMNKKLDSVTKIYCTKDLLDSISYKFENEELDYDPFINAQDSKMSMLKSLMIFKDKKNENLYTVIYTDDINDSSTTEIVLTIVNENGNYKISSIK